MPGWRARPPLPDAPILNSLARSFPWLCKEVLRMITTGVANPIRLLRREDRSSIERILRQTQVFLEMEVQCALELLDIYLNYAEQKDYICAGVVDASDQPAGYVCYGPTPMTAGTYDLYWIAVDPQWHGRGFGSLLLEYVEQQIG